MSQSRNGRIAACVAVTVALSMVPTIASASTAVPGLSAAIPGAVNSALLAKKKKKRKKSGGLTPETAEPKREAIRAAVEADVAAGRWGAAAEETANNAALLGDPLTFQEAGEYYYKQAEADRDIDAANEAIEVGRTTLDILHFYVAVDAGEAHSDWKPIDPSTASSLISDAEDLIERSEALSEEIEAEQEDSGVAGPVDSGKKKREPKPGIGLIAGGSVLTAVGVGGISMVAAGMVISNQKQNEVESLILPQDQAEVERLDEEGAQANLIAYIGAGVAVAGLAAGVPMIAIGARKRKRAGSGSESAKVQLVPSVSRRFSGVALHGRF